MTKLKFGMLFEEFVESLNENVDYRDLPTEEAQKIWDAIVKLEPRLKNEKQWDYDEKGDHLYTYNPPIYGERWDTSIGYDKKGFTFTIAVHDAYVDYENHGPTKDPKKFIELMNHAIDVHNEKIESEFEDEYEEPERDDFDSAKEYKEAMKEYKDDESYAYSEKLEWE